MLAPLGWNFVLDGYFHFTELKIFKKLATFKFPKHQHN